MEENKVFLAPGDIVLIRLEIDNRPLMLVIKKVNSMFRNEENKGPLIGMKCIWFTSNGTLLESVFSTKDLILIKKG